MKHDVTLREIVSYLHNARDSYARRPDGNNCRLIIRAIDACTRDLESLLKTHRSNHG